MRSNVGVTRLPSQSNPFPCSHGCTVLGLLLFQLYESLELSVELRHDGAHKGGVRNLDGTAVEGVLHERDFIDLKLHLIKIKGYFEFS